MPSLTRCVLWSMAVLAVAVLLSPARAAWAPDVSNPKTETPAEKLRKALDQVRDLEIVDQPLPLAINQLREQTKINFVLDRTSLMTMGMDPDQSPVNVKLKSVKLRSGLRTMLSQYHLTCAIVGDTVLITTEDMAMYRQLKQRVSLDLDNVALGNALKDLARETATNLLVDMKVQKESQVAVTLTLDDVPLDTAVRLLSELAGLKPVRVGNVLYVTSKANANELRSDPDLAPAPAGAVNPNFIMNGMMMPGMPGVMAAPPAVAAPVVETPPAVPDKPPDEKKADDKKPGDEKKPDATPPKPPEVKDKPS